MTKRAVTMLAVSALVGLADIAPATTISTPVIANAPSINETWFGGSCQVVNAGTSPIDVTITLFNQNGSALETQDVTIQPGTIGSASFFDGSARTFCRVEGVFSKRLVKVSFHPLGTSAHVTAP